MLHAHVEMTYSTDISLSCSADWIKRQLFKKEQNMIFDNNTSSVTRILHWERNIWEIKDIYTCILYLLYFYILYKMVCKNIYIKINILS